MEFFDVFASGHWGLFAVLVLGIIALPGMDMALILSSTLVDGRRSGCAATAGIVAGGTVHVAMSSLGIGLLLQRSPLAFNMLLLVGGCYVAWMGVGLLRTTNAFSEMRDSPSRPLGQSFIRAVTTCLLNPKAYVFMLAVAPQFMRPENGSLASQAIVMGGIIALIQMLVYGAVVQTAESLRVWLQTSSAGQIYLARTVGIVLISAAVLTLSSGLQTIP